MTPIILIMYSASIPLSVLPTKSEDDHCQNESKVNGNLLSLSCNDSLPFFLDTLIMGKTLIFFYAANALVSLPKIQRGVCEKMERSIMPQTARCILGQVELFVRTSLGSI